MPPSDRQGVARQPYRLHVVPEGRVDLEVGYRPQVREEGLDVEDRLARDEIGREVDREWARCLADPGQDAVHLGDGRLHDVNQVAH